MRKIVPKFGTDHALGRYLSIAAGFLQCHPSQRLAAAAQEFLMKITLIGVGSMGSAFVK